MNANSKQITPIGCWNCQHANIESGRPKEYRVGTRYRAGCNAPQKSTPGAIGTIIMTEERPDLPTCEWHEAL